MGDGGGQVVLARDQADPAGELTRHRVTRTYQRTAYALAVLTLRDEHGNEQTLRVTEEHPFYIQYAGWTPAKSLEAGDLLLGADETLTVVSNEAEKHPGGVTARPERHPSGLQPGGRAGPHVLRPRRTRRGGVGASCELRNRA
jgi:hypothetical protein